MRSALCVALLLAFSRGTACDQQKTITLAQAKDLVRIVLRHEHLRFPSRYCEIEEMKDDGGESVRVYYALGASCDFPRTPATSPIGMFYVSPRTGEVWDFNRDCKQYAFPALLKLRRQFLPNLNEAEQNEPTYRFKVGCTQVSAPAKSGSL